MKWKANRIKCGGGQFATGKSIFCQRISLFRSKSGLYMYYALTHFHLVRLRSLQGGARRLSVNVLSARRGRRGGGSGRFRRPRRAHAAVGRRTHGRHSYKQMQSLRKVKNVHCYINEL